MSLSQTSVIKLYSSVIEDVIQGVREAFLDEGVDEQVLQELKTTWESKLLSSKAVEVQPDPPEPQPPIINSQKDVAKYLNKGNVQTQPQIQQQQQQHQQPQTQQHTQPNTATNAFLQEFNNKPVPIQITLPPQQGSGDPHQRVLTIQVPASALQGNQLQSVLTGSVISATMALPQHLASALLQQHVTAALQGLSQQQQQQQQQQQIQQVQQTMTNQVNNLVSQPTDNRQLYIHHSQAGPGTVSQLDGHNDTSDDDDDEDEDEEEGDDDDEDLDDKDDEENEDNDGGAEEEPLNSGDDVSEEDPTDMFETDNVVVCQYDKISRSRNKWKFHLKDGIMNLAGKDFVFQKVTGDAEW